MNEKKTIFVNGSFLASKRLSGVQRYAIEITRKLIINLSQKNKQLIIVTNNVYSEKLKNEFSKHLKIYPSNKICFEQFILPYITKGEILLSLANSGPILHFNHYFVLHDTLIYDFSKSFTKKFVFFYKILWFFISKTAKHIFTVSEFSKSKINKHLNINKKNITVAPNGYEHLQNIKENKNKYSDYVLFVGSFTTHKNFDLLVNIYKKNKGKYPKLIMAGGFNNKVFKMPELKPKNIIFIKEFSDETLVSLYKNCLAVVFPSKFEGFGIPLLECVFFNKPIICSDIKVFREIGGDYPNYFDLKNAEKLKYYLELTKKRKQLRKGNREKILNKYTWENSAKKIVNKLQKK